MKILPLFFLLILISPLNANLLPKSSFDLYQRCFADYPDVFKQAKKELKPLIVCKNISYTDACYWEDYAIAHSYLFAITDEPYFLDGPNFIEIYKDRGQYKWYNKTKYDKTNTKIIRNCGPGG